MGVPQASILHVGFVSYCHDRSGQQTKTGTSETKSPTRKPDVRGTPIYLPTWCPGHTPKRRIPPDSKRKTKRDSSRKIGAQNDNFMLFSAACKAATHKPCGLFERAPKSSYAALLKTIDREIRFVVPTATE